MTVDELAARLAEVELIDVREQDEWDAGHIAEAVHVPLGEIPVRAAELATGGRDIAVICRAGVRSARAVEVLAAHGARAHNVEGGMQAWAAIGGSMVAGGGSPGQVI